MTRKSFSRLDLEFRRVTYTLGRNRRQKLLDELEKHIDELQKLIGNSDRLESVRKKEREAHCRRSLRNSEAMQRASIPQFSELFGANALQSIP